MNGLDLFSGIGGLSLALAPWVRTVAYCERDKYATAVLLSRMGEGALHCAPIWDDVQTLSGKMLPTIDIIFGGFPCQDISVAGRGAGLDGKRSGLFFEIVRLISECQPAFVFLENVPAIRTRGLHTVIEELSGIGYECRWTCLSAEEVGANHKRNRWFLLAYSDCDDIRNESRRRIRSSREGSSFAGNASEALANANSLRKLSEQETGKFSADRTSYSCDSVANSDGLGLEEQKLRRTSRSSRGTEAVTSASWWKTEPDVGRVANGVQFRVDRLKCLGNSVVPIQAREAFKELAGLNSVKAK